MSSESSSDPEVCCRGCGTPVTVEPGDAGAFTAVCDACGEALEGRYREESRTIVWQ
ncbi:MAG: hypothetical protein ABEJ05_02145 [Haloglomus sp.]